MKSDSILSNIRIASPCTVSWEQMTGNDQTRHCSQCNLNVYNFSEMTAKQVEQIIAASNGARVCGRLHRRADGTILTSDCPVGLRAHILKVSRRLSIALAAAMSLVFTAQASPQQTSTTQGWVSTTQVSDVALAQTGLHIFVVDASGAAIAQAQIILIDRKSGKKIAEGISDQAGSFTFADLPTGKYTALVQRPGFQPRSVVAAIKSNEMHEITVDLTVGQALMGILAPVKVLPPHPPSK